MTHVNVTTALPTTVVHGERDAGGGFDRVNHPDQPPTPIVHGERDAGGGFDRVNHPDQPHTPVVAASGLTERERDMLAFERGWWRLTGAKEAVIRERFGVTPTRYYQALNALIDKPEALAAEPQLVKRLKSLRSQRTNRHV